jgi:hypothetical protein
LPTPLPRSKKTSSPQNASLDINDRNPEVVISPYVLALRTKKKQKVLRYSNSLQNIFVLQGAHDKFFEIHSVILNPWPHCAHTALKGEEVYSLLPRNRVYAMVLLITGAVAVVCFIHEP